MAEAETSGQVQAQRPSTPTRTPERPRLPLPRESALRPPTASVALSISSIPNLQAQRDVPPRTVSFDLFSGSSIPAPSRANLQVPRAPSGLQAQRPSSSQATLGKGKAPLGPTFTPTRQQANSQSPSSHALPIGRKVSYVSFGSLNHPLSDIFTCSDGTSKAWASMPLPPPESSPQGPSNLTVPASTSPPQRPGPVSFLSIQQEQTEVASSSKAPPKSLVEIQAEEERRAQEERELTRAAQEKVRSDKEQADFLPWWKKEEGRIRRETRPVMGPPVGKPGRAKAGPGTGEGGGEQKNDPSRSRRRGRGRGGGGAKKDEQEMKSGTSPAHGAAAETGSSNHPKQ